MAVIPVGQQWRLQRLGAATELFFGVTVISNRWVFVGETNGAPYIVTAGRAGFVTDSPSFSIRVPAGSDILRAVDFLSGTELVAVGDNSVVETSINNGTDWSSQNLSSSPADLLAIVGTPSVTDPKLVAVGESIIWSRSAGGTWTLRDTTPKTWVGIGWKGGWVAVSNDGYAIQSNDGLTWGSQYQITTQAMRAVRANDNYFIAVGYNGSIFRSATGLSGSWTDYSIDTTHDFDSIAPIGATLKWCAITRQGHFYYSGDDGATWEQTANVNTYILRDIVFDPIDKWGAACGNYDQCYASAEEEQVDHVPLDQPAPPPALTDNDDMAGDAVRRLVAQFRSST